MPRRPPPSPPPSLPERPAREPLLDLEIAVVTPMFGGSPTAGQVDPDRPVTGQTIRGHLRFWWRACHAPAFDSADELFKKESEIWGSIGKKGLPGPSKIDLHVTIEAPVQCKSARELVGGYSDARRYALFPFLARDAEDSYLDGVKFRLTATAARHAADDHNSIKQEIHDAVWAWIAFGGVGARTRRGCGSLLTEHPEFQPPGDARQLATWLRERIDQHATKGERTDLQPVLSGARFVIDGRAREPLRAWGDALGIMADLRQKRDFARNHGQGNRPGRSRWPEPDSVRELLRIPDRRHRPEHPARPSFPRADLGMPIIFQQMARSDPSLEPGSTGRMASPVVLKPLSLGPGRAVPLMLILNAPHVWDADAPDIVLKQDNRKEPIGRDMLEVTDKSQLIHPLQNDRYQVRNARDALIALAKHDWHDAIDGEF